MRSQSTGILSKLDYYTFYHNIMGKNADIESTIRSIVTTQLLNPVPSDKKKLWHEYKNILLESFFQKDLADESFLHTLVSQENLELDLFNLTTKKVMDHGALNNPKSILEHMMKRVEGNKETKPHILASLVSIINSNIEKVPEHSQLLINVIDHPSSNATIYESICLNIWINTPPMNGQEGILKKIVEKMKDISPSINQNYVFDSLLYAIKDGPIDSSTQLRIFEHMVTQDWVNKKHLDQIQKALERVEKTKQKSLLMDIIEEKKSLTDPAEQSPQ